MEPDYKAALLELVEAIADRWDGESDRKRDNALTRRIEAAVDAAKALLGESVTVSENERMRREIAALRSKIEGEEQ